VPLYLYLAYWIPFFPQQTATAPAELLHSLENQQHQAEHRTQGCQAQQRYSEHWSQCQSQMEATEAEKALHTGGFRLEGLAAGDK